MDRRFILVGVRRGILGGTFDPPHLAHLLAGDTARSELALDVVTYLPAGSPWQKADRGTAAAAHRWEMTRLAVAGVDYFEADDREVQREGWTYTVDTLREFEGDDLVLILGSDAAARLPTWHEHNAVVEMAEIAVVPRPGFGRAKVSETVDRFYWLDGPLLDLSGSILRARVRAGRSIRFLVPDPVRAYIAASGLYVAEAESS